MSKNMMNMCTYPEALQMFQCVMLPTAFFNIQLQCLTEYLECAFGCLPFFSPIANKSISSVKKMDIFLISIFSISTVLALIQVIISSRLTNHYCLVLLPRDIAGIHRLSVLCLFIWGTERKDTHTLSWWVPSLLFFFILCSSLSW